MSDLWNADRYAKNASFVPEYGASLIEILKPLPGEKILDLGCGNGTLTEVIAKTGAIVTAVDASENMVIAARRLGLEVLQKSGEELDFNSEFHAVFTNAALHWMKNLDKVMQGVHKSLKPGGRFVGELGGFGNCAAICTALIAVLKQYGVDCAKRMPWYFPTVTEFSEILTRNGFTISNIETFPRPTPLKTGMRNWMDVFAVQFLESLSAKVQVQVLNEIIEALTPTLCDKEGNWIADYVRLRFSAVKA